MMVSAMHNVRTTPAIAAIGIAATAPISPKSDGQLVEQLEHTLKGIATMRDSRFSGIGILVYRRGSLSDENHSDLRPSASCPEDISLGTKGCIEELLRISGSDNKLHDGFIFFDDTGRMTHVSQYFSPQIVKNLAINENFGGRFRAAQYGSLLRGVIAIGIVEHDGECFVFSNGITVRVQVP